ncbi:MAG: SMP-30/gluconolactonase/LRE family protein, partial [Abitibacteriaceae bacterium]|nr:SMP-30/gluconolactonase/LRE family protein [Abditibacteriaceae bacterium]
MGMLQEGTPMLVNRRAFLSGAGSMLLSHTVGAQTRDFAPEAAPERYPDPDVISLDKRFDRYRILYTRIQRLYTGMGWTEGPAWHGGGQYLVWSDIPNDRQYRWLGEDGHISVFRQPSHKGNGNTFDVEGRQISCEHETRRVVRYEHSGAVTVLAETWQGKPLNAPNDVVVHPDGGIWFTDPGYGHDYFMGAPGETYLKEAIYRIDAKSGKLALVSADMVKPNGLCFSPDYQRLYVTDTNARDPHIMVNDMVGGATLRNGRRFGELKLTADGKELSGFADGIR